MKLTESRPLGEEEGWWNPLEEDFNLYDQHLIGAIEEIPTIPGDISEEGKREILHMRRFLDWKYAHGMGGAVDRNPEMYKAELKIRGLPEIEVEG